MFSYVPSYAPFVYPMPLCTTNVPYASSCALLCPYASPINSLFTLYVPIYVPYAHPCTTMNLLCFFHIHPMPLMHLLCPPYVHLCTHMHLYSPFVASYLPYLSPMCCDMTFRADLRQILILEHLDIIKILMHANATIMFQDYRCSL